MQKHIIFNIINFTNGVCNILLYISIGAMIINKGYLVLAIIWLIIGMIWIMFIPEEKQLRKMIYWGWKMDEIWVMKYSEMIEHLQENIDELWDEEVVYMIWPNTQENRKKSKEIFLNL